VALALFNDEAKQNVGPEPSVTTQNVKLIKTPYQEFHFTPVTAKYVKVKLVSTWTPRNQAEFYEFKLMGALK
jgi:hypothetical protein